MDSSDPRVSFLCGGVGGIGQVGVGPSPNTTSPSSVERTASAKSTAEIKRAMG